MKIKTVYLIVFFGLLIYNTGCKNSKPEGFPDTLYPCQVKVVKNGIPEKDVFVNCAGEGGWAVNGTTDDSGTASLSTILSDYKAAGVPVGKYTMTLTKIVDVPHTKTPQEQGKMSEGESAAYFKDYLKKVNEARSSVPAVLGTSKTPLKLSVTANAPNEITIDLKNYTNQAGNL